MQCGWIMFQDRWWINKLDHLKGNESEYENKALKIWTYHRIRTQWNTFTVLICIKWDCWVLSLVWNTWIMVKYMEGDDKQFSHWLQLVSNSHSWEAGAFLAGWENFSSECINSQISQNSGSLSSVSKDFSLFQLWLQDKVFTALNIALETEHLPKNHFVWRCSPYLTVPPTMRSPKHFGASADKNLLVVFKLKTHFRRMISRAAVDC